MAIFNLNNNTIILFADLITVCRYQLLIFWIIFKYKLFIFWTIFRNKFLIFRTICNSYFLCWYSEQHYNSYYLSIFRFCITRSLDRIPGHRHFHGQGLLDQPLWSCTIYINVMLCLNTKYAYPGSNKVVYGPCEQESDEKILNFDFSICKIVLL